MQNPNTHSIVVNALCGVDGRIVKVTWLKEFEGAQAARKHVVLLHGEPLLPEGGIGLAHRDYQPNEPVHSLCDSALCSHS